MAETQLYPLSRVVLTPTIVTDEDLSLQHEPCRQHGRIGNVQVVLAATGIGPGAAAICGFELLLCASHIQSIFFSGTSGFTPQVGAPSLTVLLGKLPLSVTSEVRASFTWAFPSSPLSWA